MIKKLDFVQSLREVGDDVFDVFNTDAEANQVRSNACFDELFIGKLTVRVACRVQHAAAGIGHVSHDADQLEAVHELDGLFTTALDAERENAAREAALELLLGKFIVLVAFEAGVVDPSHLRVVLEELGAGESVFAVTRHAEVKRFETNVQEERILRRLDGTKVAHELGSRLRDVGTLAESLRVGKAMVARIRFGEALETVVVRFPVEVAAIHNATTNCHGVAVHVLGGGVGHDVNAEFNRAAENRSRERVVHNHRNAVLVGNVGKALEVEHLARRVSNRFAEEALGVRAESLLDFFVAGVLVHERAFNTELLHRHGEEVARTAVNSGSADEVVACFADVEDGVEVCGLTGTRKHRSDTTFESSNLVGDGVVSRVLQTRVEVAGSLQVEQVRHVVGGFVLERGALVDGKDARFAVFRLPTALNAYGFWFCHVEIPFYKIFMACNIASFYNSVYENAI